MKLRPKKSLGQNFLIDKNTIKKIIQLNKIKNLNIIEIGPGTGNLTQEIIKNNPKSLLLIEKDFQLCEILKKKIQDKNNIKIVNSDVLKINFEKIIKKDTIIFGNLPYNISTQILLKLIKTNIWPPEYLKLILMFQKEVAERILAKHNTAEYGRLSIVSDWRLKIIDHFDVSKNCFYPKPKVISSVVVFEPKVNNSYKIKDIANLEKVTQIFFSNRRKMINKSFNKLFGNNKKIKKTINLDLTNRPSNLKPEDFYKMTEFYEKGLST